MAKLFNNIRRQLISEKSSVSRTSNYLKYAIGEIVLVVIGILIALAINNWNQNKNNKDSAQLHLKTIAQNIEEDLVQLNELYKFTDTTLSYSENLTRQFQTLEPIDQNTPLYIIVLVLEKSTKSNKSGFETLNNSGELAYIGKDFQDLLFKYYNIIDHIVDREEISNTFIKIRYEPYFFEHYGFTVGNNTPWKTLEDYYKDDPRGPIEFNKESFLADRTLEAMVFGRHFQIKQQHVLYKDAIEVANQLIQKIESND